MHVPNQKEAILVHPAVVEGSPIDPLNTACQGPYLGQWGSLGEKDGRGGLEGMEFQVRVAWPHM